MTTIKSTVYMESERLDNKSLPRTGGPRKLSEEQRDRLYDLTLSSPSRRINLLLRCYTSSLE